LRSLSTSLPFTHEQFFDVFGAYNKAVWPLQIIAYLLGLLAVACLFRPGAAADRVIAGILACMWIWTGIAYHWCFFTTINPAAYLFGAAFVLQGAIFLGFGVAQRSLQFSLRDSARATAGIVFIIYAAIIYPLLGLAFGISFPRMPWFGITPCPVAIFTFGLLLLSARPFPWYVIATPVLWSLIGGTAAYLLHVPQDWALLLSGIASVALLTGLRPKLLR
jgi:hypothetical protein